MSEPEVPLTHRTVRGVLWMAWGKGAHAVLQMVILAVLARLLLPAEFGVVTAALVVIGFAGVFSQLGLGPAVVQRPTLERRHIDSAFGASVLFGLILGTATWTAAPAFAAFFRIEGVAPVLRVLAILFPLNGLAVVAESLAKRDLRFRWLANVDVASYALGYGLVGITLAALDAGVWALVGGEIAKSVLRAAILLVDRPPGLRLELEARACRELLYFGGGFTIARAANYLALQGDNLVVARTLGPVALGFYGRAYGLMAGPAIGLGGVLDTVLFPAMAKVQHDRARLSRAYLRGVSLLATTILPLSAVLFVLAPEVVAIVLGPKWGEVVIPFQILAVGMLFRTSYKMSDSLARSTGAVYRRAWRQIVYAGLVILGAWLGQRWGITGVATGVLLAVTVNFALMAHLSLSLTGVATGAFVRAHLPAVLLSAAIVPVAWATAVVARGLAVSALGVAFATGTIVAVWGTLLMWRVARRLLGPDIDWALATARGMARRRDRTDVRAQGVLAGEISAGAEVVR